VVRVVELKGAFEKYEDIDTRLEYTNFKKLSAKESENIMIVDDYTTRDTCDIKNINISNSNELEAVEDEDENDTYYEEDFHDEDEFVEDENDGDGDGNGDGDGVGYEAGSQTGGFSLASMQQTLLNTLSQKSVPLPVNNFSFISLTYFMLISTNILSI
jgi:hypothetical protein